ncbi:hypothetical protein CCH79_00013914 [Gambusia affinis]|uniref:Hsp90 co-chaperone Cdc37 n=1 Tax=Gambusia affinis TaxID=33528 RepID=A0A315VXU1_GAMAF|nr:hypothetical protein CCH79_00013914 [Gambusia affinis]
MVAVARQQCRVAFDVVQTQMWIDALSHPHVHHRQHAAALLHSDWLVLGPRAERSGTQAAEQVESQDRRDQRSPQSSNRGQTGSKPAAIGAESAQLTAAPALSPQPNSLDMSLWNIQIKIPDDATKGIIISSNSSRHVSGLKSGSHGGYARLDKMAKFQQWAEDLESSFAEYRRLILEARRRLGHLEGQVKRKEEDEEREAELKEVQAEVKKLEKDEKFSLGLLEEHQRDEKKLPWNVDTTCREGFSKKHALMEQVAHQAVVRHFFLDLARTVNVDPRGCFRQFFSNIKVRLCRTFDLEVDLLKERVRRSAQAGIEGTMKETGSWREMQRSLDEKNTERLQDVMNKLNPEERRNHLQRCIDSGLWVPDLQEEED